MNQYEERVAYRGFAEVYDMFMDNIPYKDWTKYLSGLLKEQGVEEGIIVDLGCGTGMITEGLANLGYDMIGIDCSEEMLSIAREKEQEGILYLHQDMREIELFGTVAGFVSICDSMNYILTDEDMREVFRLVNNYLEEDGVFIFDMNTEYKYEHILGDNTFAENREEAGFIWLNEYDKEEKINEYELSIYVKENDDLFRRFDEIHYQRAYSLDKIKELIEQSGLHFVAAYDAFTKNTVHEKSERIYIIAKEGRQEGKLYTK